MRVTVTTGSDDCIDIDGVRDSHGMDTCAAEGAFGLVRIGPTAAIHGDQPAGSAVVLEFHYTTKIGARGDGCWVVAAYRVAEDVPLLRVEVAGRPGLDGDRGYNVIVSVDVPAGTPVFYALRDEATGKQDGPGHATEAA